ncbi:deoxyribodipyrimidine photo-lyase [Coraliomargarita sp. SDUM461004]|uniref:Deoxyribodipyrimidine photo-lyase n=1 Tax=Thalassobacterium sedimentorum TaxID=3041258 RepID=A0ABU1AGT9_9BACT|nr:deoxyribodipyrimidine photo-lyase [Coraliomargarita sp. SDUM461004]MDQ8193912.1 deoxyribodipyrimidine photo-lyase [Coraliomargarita sp. SDUM461004]
MSQSTTTLFWFRQDLRFADNAALAAEITSGASIVPVFIWAPQEEGDWGPAAASRWWLHHALASFAEQWAAKGARLVLRQGNSLEELRTLIASTGATRVVWNRRYESPQREFDIEIKRELRSEGIEVDSYNSRLLIEPHAVATGTGKPYQVYTPYWKKVKDWPLDAVAEPDLEALRFPEEFPDSLALEQFNLLPQHAWDRGFYEQWSVSEADAIQCLEGFLAGGIQDYASARDRPDVCGTSQLSPYLYWGQIGPRQIVSRLKATCDLSQPGPATFLKEIYWREFAYHVLYHFPHTASHPLRAEYEDFPWVRNSTVLRAWQTGHTGYPIVDAGMRQLWQVGWMHNRVRMIVSSFLVKHLLHDWRDGARWFWETLVDADLASNTLGWQWSGGCGADAAPYFRIFNPILQGQKFDPEGEYVKRYLPELRRLPAKYIHKPWDAPESVLTSADVLLGRDYPRPIVEHRIGRERALAALKRFKS